VSFQPEAVGAAEPSAVGRTRIRTFSAAVPDAASEAKPRICIVTTEIVGPHKNGGIGTAMTGLAETLAGYGLPVTILYTGSIWSVIDNSDWWRDKYAAIGIDFHALHPQDAVKVAGPLKLHGFPTPWLIYDFLRQRSFDVVHFNDTIGEGFYCLAAKRLGIAFRDALFMVGLHSPSQWVLEHNSQLPNSVLYAAFNYAERLSVQCADILWAPSRYLVGWLRDQGFKLPAVIVNQQYVMPTARLFNADRAKFSEHEALADTPRRRRVPSEIVFFGRLEERKGIGPFCDALDVESEFLAERDISVTFLGKPVLRRGVSSDDYVKMRGQAWPCRWRIISDYGQQEAVAYLRNANALAVMPSPFDNSPCTIYEALGFGIPFIASRTGGIPELIAETDHARVLFDYSPPAIAAALRRAIVDGIECARPALAPGTARRQWLNAHLGWRGWLEAARPRRGPRDIIECASALVIIDDRGDTGNLERTLESLRPALATLTRSEVVVIDRSLSRRAANAHCGHAPLRIANVHRDDPAAIVCERILAGDGGLVLFLAGGAALLAQGLTLLTAMFGDDAVDGVIPAANCGDETNRQVVPALGGSIAFGYFEGVGFTGGAAIKRDSLKAIAARSNLVPQREFLGLLDLAVIDGLALWPLAEPALDITHADKTNSSRMDEPALSRRYVTVDAWEAYYIAAVGYSTYRNNASGYLANALLSWRRPLWMQLNTLKVFRLALAVAQRAGRCWNRWRRG
jgi:glycosyltransferase involved in cell wall biosynthesis